MPAFYNVSIAQLAPHRQGLMYLLEFDQPKLPKHFRSSKDPLIQVPFCWDLTAHSVMHHSLSCWRDSSSIMEARMAQTIDKRRDAELISPDCVHVSCCLDSKDMPSQ